jgi:hypothetical protein
MSLEVWGSNPNNEIFDFINISTQIKIKFQNFELIFKKKLCWNGKGTMVCDSQCSIYISMDGGNKIA